MNDGSGLTTEEKMQQEIGGDKIMLIFLQKGLNKPILEQAFQSGVTFEWVKNKVAEAMFARYEDLSLFHNGKRIPEPFSICDLQMKSGQEIEVQIAEGAVYGEEALRQ